MERGVSGGIENGNLAVGAKVCRLQRGHGCSKFGESIGAVDGIAGVQTNARALLVCENAIAIVFFFVDPPGFVKRFAHQRRQHGLHTKWDLIRHGMGAIRKRFRMMICGAGLLAGLALLALYCAVLWLLCS